MGLPEYQIYSWRKFHGSLVNLVVRQSCVSRPEVEKTRKIVPWSNRHCRSENPRLFGRSHMPTHLLTTRASVEVFKLREL